MTAVLEMGEHQRIKMIYIYTPAISVCVCVCVNLQTVRKQWDNFERENIPRGRQNIIIYVAGEPCDLMVVFQIPFL